MQIPARFQGRVNRIVELSNSYLRSPDRHPEVRTSKRELRDVEIDGHRRDEKGSLPLCRPRSAAANLGLHNEDERVERGTHSTQISPSRLAGKLRVGPLIRRAFE